MKKVLILICSVILLICVSLLFDDKNDDKFYYKLKLNEISNFIYYPSLVCK